MIGCLVPATVSAASQERNKVQHTQAGRKAAFVIVADGIRGRLGSRCPVANVSGTILESASLDPRKLFRDAKLILRFRSTQLIAGSSSPVGISDHLEFIKAPSGYAQLVSIFARTFFEDILNALQAIIRALEPALQTKMYSGIPLN